MELESTPLSRVETTPNTEVLLMLVHKADEKSTVAKSFEWCLCSEAGVLYTTAAAHGFSYVCVHENSDDLRESTRAGCTDAFSWIRLPVHEMSFPQYKETDGRVLVAGHLVADKPDGGRSSWLSGSRDRGRVIAVVRQQFAPRSIAGIGTMQVPSSGPSVLVTRVETVVLRLDVGCWSCGWHEDAVPANICERAVAQTVRAYLEVVESTLRASVEENSLEMHYAFLDWRMKHKGKSDCWGPKMPRVNVLMMLRYTGGCRVIIKVPREPLATQLVMVATELLPAQLEVVRAAVHTKPSETAIPDQDNFKEDWYQFVVSCVRTNLVALQQKLNLDQLDGDTALALVTPVSRHYPVAVETERQEPDDRPEEMSQWKVVAVREHGIEPFNFHIDLLVPGADSGVMTTAAMLLPHRTQHRRS